jgi:hypothetical protein
MQILSCSLDFVDGESRGLCRFESGYVLYKDTWKSPACPEMSGQLPLARRHLPLSCNLGRGIDEDTKMDRDSWQG